MKMEGAKAELKFDGARLAGVLLIINWLTPLVGLGNLIFLWRDKKHRVRASIALGLTLGMIVIIIPILFISFLPPEPMATGISTLEYEAERLVYEMEVAVLFQDYILLGVFFAAGMAIWMTVDALIAYSKYKSRRGER